MEKSSSKRKRGKAVSETRSKKLTSRGAHTENTGVAHASRVPTRGSIEGKKEDDRIAAAAA